MPITEASKQALRALKLVQPTMIHPQNDLGYYDALMASGDVPDTASPSQEVKWVAFKVPLPNGTPDRLRAIWGDAPSKVAATWLRQLRKNSKLQAKFWTDTWPYYIESRLALELKAGVQRGGKVSGSGRGVRTGGDSAMRESMGRSIEQVKKAEDGKLQPETAVGGHDG